jgi:hypothetical protein
MLIFNLRASRVIDRDNKAYFTDWEAKSHYCPHLLRGCEGSSCPDWRWIDGPEIGIIERRGFCGLAGKPEVL